MLFKMKTYIGIALYLFEIGFIPNYCALDKETFSF